MLLVAMPDPTSPAAIRQLIVEFIDSHEKLEIIVHLHGHRGHAQTPMQIATATRVVDKEASEALLELRRDGLVTSAGSDDASWQIELSGPRAACLEALVRLYEENRVDALKLMSEASIERARALMAQRFADAFFIGAKRKKGDSDG